MHRTPLRSSILASVILVVLLIGIGTGVALDRQVLAAAAAPSTLAPTTGPDFGLIEQAWNVVHRVYVDGAAEQPRRLTYGAISGMVNALGDTGHSRFLSPEMVRQERNFTHGSFEGIGAELQTKNGQSVILAPIDGSPAQKAGLRPGDVIIKVDGHEVTSLPLSQVVGRILGPAGTPVTLTLQDPRTGQTRDVTLVRARITLQSVTWQRLPGTTVADVRIAAFSRGTSSELKQALDSITRQGMTGIILDLRNNPGGLLDETVGTVSQFLRRGTVLLVRNAQGKVTPIPVQPGGVATNLPVVVLINGGTASAAEIVAGALQDAHRALLIGETTFGTGTVLQQFRLSDGSALMLATDEWLTPDGRVIWHKGITPDMITPLSPTATPVLPEAARRMTPAQLRASGDTQLLRASDMLTSRRIRIRSC